MALPATDTFTGTNNDPLSASWTTIDGGFDIQSNKASSTQNQGNGAYWNADSFNGDQYSEAVIDVDSATLVAVGVRMAALRGYIAIVYNSNTSMDIQRINSDESYTVLQTTNLLTFATGDTIRLEVEGSALRAYQNDNLRVSASDGAYADGAAGIWIYNAGTSALIDSWEGGNLAADPSTTDGKILIAPVGFS